MQQLITLKGLVMSKNVIILSAFAVWVALFMTGCQTSVPISWTAPQSEPANGKTVYLRQASSVGGAIGCHTWTLFAIPGPEIRAADRGVDEAVTDAVQDAFKAAGYIVRPYTEAPPGSPVVAPSVQKFDYWSYTYLWPITFQGGRVEIGVKVDKDGQGVRGERTFCSSSPFWVRFMVACGFEGAVHDDMTRIVREMKDEASRDSLIPPLPEQRPSPPPLPLAADKLPVTKETACIAETHPQIKSDPVPSEEALAQKTRALKDRIHQLKSAHDAGILTDDEYRMKVKPVTDELMNLVLEGGAL